MSGRTATQERTLDGVLNQGWRVLLSCASTAVREDLFEPGEFDREGAEREADRIVSASWGIQAYVVPSHADPRQVLHEKGWI